jgi:hypothetical protein
MPREFDRHVKQSGPWRLDAERPMSARTLHQCLRREPGTAIQEAKP